MWLQFAVVIGLIIILSRGEQELFGFDCSWPSRGNCHFGFRRKNVMGKTSSICQ